jgi:butyryl-CoA dehydrogenase
MVMEEVGTLGYIFACVFGVGAELVCDAIIQHGTDRQREDLCQTASAGRSVCGRMPHRTTRGLGLLSAPPRRRCARGSDFILNGQKRFIVGAEGADYFLVYAKTDPAAKPHKALTCFIVDRGPGVETRYLIQPHGMPRWGAPGGMVFKDVRVPAENIVGQLNGAYAVFNTMMIPERLGTAAMTIGAARPALDVATRYTSRRRAFGQIINQFQGVSFQIAEAAMLLDAARAMVYTTARAVSMRTAPPAFIRRQVSETKKFVTESCQKIAHHAMQVMGGIGYTDIFPVERIIRDLRLASIWTGSNEVMAMIIANEWYREQLSKKPTDFVRTPEDDAESAFAVDEKIYE